MLLFPTVLITSLAATHSSRVAFEPPPPVVSLEQKSFLSLGSWSLPGCVEFPTKRAAQNLGCTALMPVVGQPELAWHADLLAPAHQPLSNALAQPRSGFLHLDLLTASRFGLGPEVWWATPEAANESLLRQRWVTPGIGFWYSSPSRLFMGVSANTWLSTLGEAWFVNTLSSEARFGFSL